MATFEWQPFLEKWSQEIIEAGEYPELPPEVVASGWLGFPGATEEQITQAEARLGVGLPPSYRDFLKVTNGWRQTGTFIWRMWSTEEMEWFSVRNHQWVNAYLRPWGIFSTPPKNPSIPDDEYFVYGDHQDPARFRPEYLRTALEISEEGDSAIYLLNPKVVTPDGEWEAWFFANWNPGADRFRSFAEMMQAEYRSFRECAKM
jgi:SMI1/KNR4 family protein SUKH-1